jgi:thymidylate synthase (FAD)
MLNVKLIAYTPEPERVVAAAARLCYSAVGVEEILEKQTPENTTKFVKMLASMGHESPIEHVSFTFAVEGVSRALLAQLTRHRLASYSVQSQRYVRLDDFQFVIPPEIAADPASKETFLTAMKKQGEDYLALAASLQAKHKAELMEQGLEEKDAEKKAEKMANEDARFVLPNACETKLVVTMNARSLKNFFKLRCCNRAQWEIRALAEEMFRLVYPVAPAIFSAAGPSCVVCGHCTEGRMTCGKMREVQEKYHNWKNQL